MGNPIPPEDPEPEPIDPDKWYCISCHTYLWGPTHNDCSGYDLGNFRCCRKGDLLIAWIAGNMDCYDYFQLCWWPGATNQRLNGIIHEYDFEADCLNEC